MKIIIILFGILLLGALFACSPKNIYTDKASLAETTVIEAQKTTKEPWQAEWEKNLAQAKKEGKLSVYTRLGPNVRPELQKAFKEKYGIDVEFTSGRTAELDQKILSEQRAGLYLVDMITTGRPSNLLYKQSNLIQPLAPLLLLPEVKDPNSWFEGRIPYLDKDGYIIAYTASVTGHLAINTEMVRKDEIRFARDLLNPRWKGKILMDDPVYTSRTQAQLSIWLLVHGEEIIKKLAAQQPILLRDERLQAEWIGRGKYPVAISPAEPVREMIRAGLPISYHALEDVMYLASSSSNISVFNRAPHPFAAKIFLNWFLSKEGQTINTEFDQLHTARIDVDASLVEPSKRREPGIKYFNAITEEFEIDISPKLKRTIVNIFAQLK